MELPDFETFSAAALAQGYETVVPREWAPLAEVNKHTHPFEADALVVQGEMWLTVGEDTQYLVPGGRFHLVPGTEHSERYGAEGATYWVARR